ncbi:TPA: peptidyl-prolyl cis-trans isomerase [Candidatus Poribacteria bacterium]|nr:peptidyl-prolyl cis-trans isomerase [Candidatus Poribacteria bacterium]
MLRYLFLLIIIFMFLMINNHSQSELIDYLVAVVNNEPITMSMLEDAMNAFWINPDERPKSPEQALDYVIDHKIKLQEARKLGIFVNEEELKIEMARINSNFSSNDELTKTLKRQGMSLDDLQTKLSEEIMIRKMVERRFGQFIRESELEGEATAFFEQNKAKFIIPESIQMDQLFFKLEPNSDQSLKQKIKNNAEETLEMLKKDSDFLKYPNSLRTGYISIDQIKPIELAGIVANMNVGDISGIIETSEGYYIIKLNDRRASRQATFNEVKDQIQAQIRKQKIKADLEAEIKKKREIAEIKIIYQIKK